MRNACIIMHTNRIDEVILFIILSDIMVNSNISLEYV